MACTGRNLQYLPPKVAGPRNNRPSCTKNNPWRRKTARRWKHGSNSAPPSPPLLRNQSETPTARLLIVVSCASVVLTPLEGDFSGSGADRILRFPRLRIGRVVEVFDPPCPPVEAATNPTRDVTPVALFAKALRFRGCQFQPIRKLRFPRLRIGRIFELAD